MASTFSDYLRRPAFKPAPAGPATILRFTLHARCGSDTAMQTQMPGKVAAINPTALATGALGVTVALAWNDAVLTAIDALFPRAADGNRAAVATAAYAVVVTIFVVAAAAAYNAVAARPARAGAGCAGCAAYSGLRLPGGPGGPRAAPRFAP